MDKTDKINSCVIRQLILLKGVDTDKLIDLLVSYTPTYEYDNLINDLLEYDSNATVRGLWYDRN